MAYKRRAVPFLGRSAITSGTTRGPDMPPLRQPGRASPSECSAASAQIWIHGGAGSCLFQIPVEEIEHHLVHLARGGSADAMSLLRIQHEFKLLARQFQRVDGL